MLQLDNTLWFKGNIKANPTSVCTSFSVHVFMNDFKLLHEAEVGADLNWLKKTPNTPTLHALMHPSTMYVYLPVSCSSLIAYTFFFTEYPSN